MSRFERIRSVAWQSSFEMLSLLGIQMTFYLLLKQSRRSTSAAALRADGGKAAFTWVQKSVFSRDK